MEFQAAEAARKLEVAEVLAKDAASEKRFAHEQTTKAMFAREELDRQMTAIERQELERINTELETGKLMSKLRKTSIISKVSQVALAATLVFSLGYMFTVGSPVSPTGNVTNATEAKVNIAAPVVAEAVIVNTQVTEPIILASFKMATELGSSQLTGMPSQNISSN
jgi:anti-sigma factor RsiW